MKTYGLNSDISLPTLTNPTLTYALALRTHCMYEGQLESHHALMPKRAAASLITLACSEVWSMRPMALRNLVAKTEAASDCAIVAALYL